MWVCMMVRCALVKILFHLGFKVCWGVNICGYGWVHRHVGVEVLQGMWVDTQTYVVADLQ